MGAGDGIAIMFVQQEGGSINVGGLSSRLVFKELRAESEQTLTPKKSTNKFKSFL